MSDDTKRVIDQTTDSQLSAGDYVMVDSQSEGTRKFDLGTELTNIKQDLAELQNDSGVTAELKSALLQLASKVAYIDDDGEDYYQDLYDALYPNASSISCVYTQTGTVYTTDTLDSLKDDLVVTAHYSDSTTRTLAPSDYTLSGTLTAGTSTISVHYGELNTTFTVTVTARTLSSISAVYTQSGTVYADDDIDSLKTDLVVTATYNDSSSETLSSADYTLSGSLTSGTSTITVTYESKTTTFTVTVTAPLYSFPNVAETTLTKSGKTGTIKVEDGVITYSGNYADVLYIDKNGNVTGTQPTNNKWFGAAVGSHIINKAIDIAWQAGSGSNQSLNFKWANNDATGNLLSAVKSIESGSSGTDGEATMEVASLVTARDYSAFAFQWLGASTSGTVSFKMRVFIDDVRYF